MITGFLASGRKAQSQDRAAPTRSPLAKQLSGVVTGHKCDNHQAETVQLALRIALPMALALGRKLG